MFAYVTVWYVTWGSLPGLSIYPQSNDAQALLGIPSPVPGLQDQQASPLSYWPQIKAGWRVKTESWLVWPYSGSTILILGDLGAALNSCMFQKHLLTPESSRALWPMPREGVVGFRVCKWRTMMGHFNLITIRQASRFLRLAGNVWVGWRDRNIYKSGEQVCMGLQVH